MTKNTDKNSSITRSRAQLQPERALPNTNPVHQAIRNCRALRQAIAQGCHEFRLFLAGGVFMSRKYITLDRRNRFRVENHIDDTVQMLTGRQLYTRSNIGRAMQRGAFVTEGQSHD